MSLKKRVKRVTTEKVYARLTLDQALDMAISAKVSEGVRERTVKDYVRHFSYFKKWILKNHADVQYVDEITTNTVRDFVLYMKHGARRYEGHKYIKAEGQRVGLTDVTINIRLRTLKPLFNQLDRDDLIEVNPTLNVKLLRQDIDLTNGLTDKKAENGRNDEVTNGYERTHLRDNA